MSQERVSDSALYSLQNEATNTRSGERKIKNIDELPRLSYYASRPKSRYAVDRLIPLSQITLFASESGHGKSYFLLWLVFCVSQGLTALGRETTKCSVLVLDAENPWDIVADRVGLIGIDLNSPNLHYWGTFTEDPHPALDSPMMLEWAAKNPDSVIIVDSQAAFIEGDENSAKDVAAFYGKLRKLASLGPAVVVLHHTGKAETSKEYRGSSYIKGACDVAFNVTNYGGNRLEKMHIRAFKTRSAAIDTELNIHFKDGQFIPDEQPNAAVKAETEQLTELLRQNPGITTERFVALASGRKLGRNSARKFLDIGVRAGEIRRTDGPKNSKSHWLLEGSDSDSWIN